MCFKAIELTKNRRLSIAGSVSALRSRALIVMIARSPILNALLSVLPTTAEWFLYQLVALLLARRGTLDMG
jgi:hypothetical protein